ncbi:MAG: sulfatase-like hydrolase/transferase [Deltaproteobacteria bacterium]|nr:sulfatase-like hydrolase/transferase [Deltaproteobacteria bacterium]
MSSKKPNIIYFYSDQHRHDAMGCAGNSVIKTPNLDRMANEGMRFSRAYSQCPVCQPARASVLTGLYNHQHNISQNFVKDFDPGWSTINSFKARGIQRLRSARHIFIHPGGRP